MRAKYTALVAAVLLAVLGIVSPALAHSSPTVAQVRHQISHLNDQMAVLGQKYDSERQALASANAEDQAAARAVKDQQALVTATRKQAAQIVVVLYEHQNQLAQPLSLLINADPQRILDANSVLTHLSADDAYVLRHYAAQVRVLDYLKGLVHRYEDATGQIRKTIARSRHQLEALRLREAALLGSLAAAEQAGIGPGGGGGGSYNGPTGTQAEQAIAFAYAQLGCPYVWGGTGPCSAGYDCSGLMQAAYAYAGVSIPRTSEDDWAELPHIPMSELQPGDLLIFEDAGHVGMYVGGGMLIDAPQPGENVEKIALSNPWYTSNLVGAVRP